jgi:hypothetical protein
LGTL